MLVLMMLFIHRQYRVRATARGPRRGGPPAPTPGGARRRTGPWIPRGRQRRNVARSIASDVRAVYVADDPEEAARFATGGSASYRTYPWWSWSRLTAPSWAAPLLPPRSRGDLAARQAGSRHVRRDPRVRRTEPAGKDPLQPVRKPAPTRADRPAAHGGRQRPLPRTTRRTNRRHPSRRLEKRPSRNLVPDLALATPRP